MADTDRKLRVAGIGIGGIWRYAHGQAWLDHPQVELVGLCDIVESKAAAWAKENNLPATLVCTDYKEILERDDVDAVDICTPNRLHSEIAVAALKAGKHVFCEKPDAINPQRAQEMADAASQSGKVLLVMRNNRFRNDMLFLKRFTDAGGMGKVYAGRCGWIRRRGIPGKGGWFTTKSESGGGPLIDLGVHYLDLAIWIMGNPRPVSVVGATYCKFAEGPEASDSVHSSFGEAAAGGTFDVEDLASGWIRFDNGASLQIEFSWASNIEHENAFLELRGTKAGCAVGDGKALTLYTEIEGTLCDITPRPAKERLKPHAIYLNHFVDVVAGRAKPILKPEHGVDMIKILAAIYESARTGKEVQL